jgi:tetratricopeptide (TPR) repeat protein
MIIDNADDVEVFTSPSHLSTDIERNVSRRIAGESNTPSYLLEFLPQSPNGSILITSRSRDAAFRLAGSYADIIRVDPMDQERALALLQNKLHGGLELDDAAGLVEALDYMPLAIAQAAAYIGQRAPRVTVSKYLLNFRKGERSRAELLNNDMGDSRRDGRSSNSIISTWQISFEHIRRESPSATQLLSLMSLFDRQGIPESLLIGHYQDDTDARPDSDARSSFETDLNILTNFSLVAIDVDGDQFKMHRLVQFSTRKWLELQGELEIWRKKYAIILDDCYPNGDFETWQVCRALFPHAQAALACRPADDDALLKWSNLLHKAGWNAVETGNFDAAIQLQRAALEATESILGAEDPRALSTASDIGYSLISQGKYDEAGVILRRTVELSEKLLGPESLTTLASFHNLGLLYEWQGKFDDAEVMTRRVLETNEKLLGPEDPRTLASVYNLGMTLYRQGKFDEAEVTLQRVVEIHGKVLGREHPQTLHCTVGLARLLLVKGPHEAALELYKRAYDGSVKTFGSDHRITIKYRRYYLGAQTVDTGEPDER